MSIVATDIHYRLSVITGSAGDTTSQADPNASLGKYAASNDISGTALNDLFDNVSGDERAAGDTEYRCLFVYNAHVTLTWQGVIAWLSATPTIGTISIAVDSTAAKDVDSVTAQALQIADESDSTSVLSGLTFSSPTNKGAGIVIGDLAPDFCRAIWVKRIIPAGSTAQANDGVTIRCEGDTL